MTKEIKTYIVDAFTDEPFKGNQAGVCVLSNKLSDKEMLAIAKELGFSETAYVIPKKKSGEYIIRFFSPKMEIPLCGHATLAAAKVMFNDQPSLTKICFETMEGRELPIAMIEDKIAMDFPVFSTVPYLTEPKLLAALGLEEVSSSHYNIETKIILLEIDDSAQLEQMAPDFQKLVKSHADINGVLVTTRSERKGFDFESRYFWPWSGTNEDPVTGATHTFLTEFWGRRLGKRKMRSFQCSERTGFMEVELMENGTVCIKGDAIVILSGVLAL